MSPDMLTLVAAVLVYDFALESCDPRSVRLLALSLNVRSETREEKDIVGAGCFFIMIGKLSEVRVIRMRLSTSRTSF